MSKILPGLPYSICAIIADPSMSCNEYDIELLLKRQIFEVMSYFRYPLFYVFGDSEFNRIVIDTVQKMASCPPLLSDPVVITLDDTDMLPAIADLEKLDDFLYAENKTFENYLHWIYYKAESVIYYSDINLQTPLPFLNLLYRFQVKAGTVYNIVPKLACLSDKPHLLYIDRLAANLEILDCLSKYDKDFPKRRTLVLKRIKSVKDFRRLKHILENCIVLPPRPAC